MASLDATAIFGLTTLRYQLADYFKTLRISQRAPFIKRLLTQDAVVPTTDLKGGVEVWEQAPTITVSNTLDDLPTLDTIDAPTTGEYNIRIFQTAFKMTATQLQAFNRKAQALLGGKWNDPKVRGIIDPTIRKFERKVLNRFVASLLLDVENYMVNGNSGLGVIGLKSVVSPSSGPSTSFAGIDLTSLDKEDGGQPWYIKASGGTGSGVYGETLTGDATMGLSNTLKWIQLLIVLAQMRGVFFDTILVNTGDYIKWMKAYHDGLTVNKNATDVGIKSVFGIFKGNKTKSDTGYMRALGIDANGTMADFVASPKVAAGELYLVDTSMVNLEVLDPKVWSDALVAKFRDKVVEKTGMDTTPWLSIISDTVKTSASGLGRGAVVEAAIACSITLQEPSGVAAIAYDASTA